MLPFHRVIAVAIATSGLTVISACATPPSTRGDANLSATSAACPVRGVWELVSVSVDGKDQPLAIRQWKVVTGRHFMWLAQAGRRDTLPLQTQLDTLRVYRLDGGAGTYTTSGDNYVENIDLFVDPSWIGTSFRAKCRIEGGQWIHSFNFPNDTTVARGPYQRIVEVWRRIE
jgi:hypothetical protein